MRLHQEKPQLKVILMSGYGPEATGCNTDFVSRLNARFLAKPYSSRTLLEMVRNCLDDPAKLRSSKP